MPSAAPDPADDAAALAAVLLARDVAALALPSPVLGGWQSLAAVEYGAAVLRLHRTLQAAAEAFRAAGSAA